ncbi:hypothetical protein MTP99_016351 [Tenebrio molitor]|nr:hypothetical protein MTP99_016351 [Tenebrio molitor]
MTMRQDRIWDAAGRAAPQAAGAGLWSPPSKPHAVPATAASVPNPRNFWWRFSGPEEFERVRLWRLSVPNLEKYKVKRTSIVRSDPLYEMLSYKYLIRC